MGSPPSLTAATLSLRANLEHLFPVAHPLPSRLDRLSCRMPVVWTDEGFCRRHLLFGMFCLRHQSCSPEDFGFSVHHLPCD